MGKGIIVSNRLPVTVSREDSGFQYHKSLGGLATGLKSYHEKAGSLWLGWSGIPTDEMTEAEQKSLVDEMDRDYQCRPVFLTKLQVDLYYHGFCNNTIWPLFHYFTNKVVYDPETWRAYQLVNRQFFEALEEVMEDGDQVWIHDYHLMLLPRMIREAYPNARIGFFLHIPFPSNELFRLLIWREDILEGLLGADLVGFHTYDYVRHFLSSVRRLLRLDCHLNTIQYGDRYILADAFPMGIDYEKFSLPRADDPEFVSELNAVETSLSGNRLILSVDRLDYTKGIPNRIRAFDTFLTRYPEYAEQVRMVLIVAPSREDVASYEKLKKEIEVLVSDVNGKHGTLDWMPIWFYYKPFSQESLIAFYRNADVMLVTPLRDGMNLVAKEYVAARTDGKGMVVISETAGAASELGEAIHVNAYDYEAIAEGLRQALLMSDEEKVSINRLMNKRLRRYNVNFWATDFLERLTQMIPYPAAKSRLTNLAQNSQPLLDQWKKASKRLLLLDYDGTLTGFTTVPEQALPDPELKQLLQQLVSSQRTTVAIVSGRDRNTLDNWLGELSLNLVASHGLWLKRAGGEWEMTVGLDNSWKPSVLEILQLFSDRMPGSQVEEKDYSLAFHYRRCDPDMVASKLGELKDAILDMIQSMSLTLLEGNKVLEVKDVRVNKGFGASSLLNLETCDFILAAGDDHTDEDLFLALPDHAYAVKVRFGNTHAPYYLASWQAMRKLLHQLADHP